MGSYTRDVFIAFLALLALFIFIPFYTYLYFANDLTSKDAIMNRNDSGVILLDRNNKPFFNLYQAKEKKFVTLAQINDDAKHAVISIEDKDFYKHPAFSIRAIIRALYSNFLAKKTVSGGSTITQQLVKNALLTPQKSYVRKLQEIILAQEIERRYSKNEILEMYLNSVYFGEGAFGIEAAANTYFDKSAADLTLAESAFLAALLPAPSRYSPYAGGFSEAKKIQEIILQKMRDQGYITESQKKEAIGQKLVFPPKKEDINKSALHFGFMVRDELVTTYGEEYVQRSGFTVKTTLNSEWQKIAEQAVADQVRQLAGNRVSNGAAVVEDVRTGEILSLVGSFNWNNPEFGKVNVALSPRQPGSSFKPIYYVYGLSKGIITPATALRDEPTTYVDGEPCRRTCNTAGKLLSSIYKPVDYDRKFRGIVTVRRALANSLNVPSVEVMYKVGIPGALESAKSLGITTLSDPSQYGLSLALGAGEVKLEELTNAYATFGNKGLRNNPTTILEIRDKSKNLVYSYNPAPTRVLDEASAFIISSILSDRNARSEVFGNALNISHTAAVKTGTTEDFRDAWTIGYTPSLAIGVWVGNNNNATMDSVAGSLGAAPIWRRLMETFLEGTLNEEFAQPENVVKARPCSGKTSDEFFVQGTEGRGVCISPSPTISGTPSASPTPTLTPVPTPTFTPKPTPSPTTLLSPTPTPTILPSPTITGSILLVPRRGGKR